MASGSAPLRLRARSLGVQHSDAAGRDFRPNYRRITGRDMVLCSGLPCGQWDRPRARKGYARWFAHASRVAGDGVGREMARTGALRSDFWLLIGGPNLDGAGE